MLSGPKYDKIIKMVNYWNDQVKDLKTKLSLYPYNSAIYIMKKKEFIIGFKI